MLSTYAKNEWLTITAVGLLTTVASVVVGWWWLALLILPVTAALLAFFRDPNRKTPSQRGAMIAPADGRISSIHHVEHFEPFDGPATCIRIFLSVLDVHINRSPCHGQVTSITHKPGDHKNALNPDSAETNESNLIVLVHPIRRHPLAAVRQVSGILARTITCGAHEGDVVQRGQRIGMIKLGSTTELYLPADLQPQVTIQQGQKVYAGLTVLAMVTSIDQLDPYSKAVKPPEQQPERTDEPSKQEEAEPARSTSV
jgi:phosphatidylserine decarboxylase